MAPASFRQRGGRHSEFRRWPGAGVSVSLRAAASRQRQPSLKTTACRGTAPRLIGQAHTTDRGGSGANLSPFPSKGDAFISFVPYHTATE